MCIQFTVSSSTGYVLALLFLLAAGGGSSSVAGVQAPHHCKYFQPDN